MSAYFVGTIRVIDPVMWTEYRSQVDATILKYGGTILFRGATERVINGNATHEAVVSLEFSSIEAALRWHTSPEYQALIPLRMRGAEVDLVLYQRTH